MWTVIIPEICKRIESLGVKYHVDASSSLYVYGLDFEMDDLDITVEWGKIGLVRQAFLQHQPEAISGTEPQKFTFVYRQYLIDVMSYQSESGIGLDSERIQVNFSGHTIWSKTPSFYLNRMRKDHPLRTSAFRFFKHHPLKIITE
ncbi:hypothetical protein [Reinekea blandensis]|uniref:Uncharacterized protein n=1 Tax=Reinekea blandensis MED297 TaxID=314283 RepID=A4BB54_9GAMM|nr:hypothetical protein [Reinekea blandensis]EAR10667.1 hypothetical protein MED297_11645 [Reinekea sp. MED297] [Reinekea blandensis MED297]